MLSCLPAATYAQSAVEWLPLAPAQGSLAMIIVRPGAADSVIAVRGSLGGEPLHFESDGTSYRAIAGVPISARATIPLTIAVDRRRTPTEHRFVRIPVSTVEFPSERLRVNPRFTQPPDSALQARLDEENRKSRAVSRRTHETPRLWRPPFTLPVRASRVTSAFGTARVFNGEVTSRHMGVDFDGRESDPVYAPNYGVVALTGDFYYAGKVVYLDHGRGLVTAYLHLSEILVAPGDTVAPGQIIGRIGATGRVTGPHLHWVGRYGRVTIDPRSLLELDLGALGSTRP